MVTPPDDPPRARDSWLPSVVAVALFVALLLGSYANGLVMRPGSLTGPDSHMWLYLVETAHSSGDGLAHPIGGMESPRSNAPHGETLHWTLPFFALLYVPAWLGAALTGASFGQVLFGWAVVVSPLLLAASVLVMVWGLGPLLRPGERFVVTLFLLMNAGLLLGFQAARPDHQALSLLLIAVAVAVGIRWMLRPWSMEEITGRLRWDPMAVALVAALVLSLWVSVDGLILVLVLNLGYGLCGLLMGNWGHVFRLIKLMFFTAVFGQLAAWLTEVGSPDSLPADTLSDAHVYLLLSAALFWAALSGQSEANPLAKGWPQGKRRLVCTLLLIMAAVFFFFGIGALLDPYSTMDERVREIWQEGVIESRPLYQSLFPEPGVVLIFLLPALAGLGFCLWSWRRGEARLRPAWLLLAAGIGAYAAVSFFVQQRFFTQANLLAAGPFALLVWRGLQLEHKPMPLLKAFAVGNAFTLLGGILWLWMTPLMPHDDLVIDRVTARKQVAAAAPSQLRDSASEVWPQVMELTDWLNANAKEPATIMAFINIGPELLYRTPLSVVSTPYHRNNAGILDEWTFFTRPPGEYAAARQIARERGVGYVLVRPFHPEERAYYAYQPGREPTALWGALAEGRPPVWLEEVALPVNLRPDFRLYRTQFSE
ncbi:MAG: hypothetical protein AAGK14_04290 [Verrucomicrobiota bacterium]